jgi:hemolysin III
MKEGIKQSLGEEISNSISHGIMAIASFVMFILLLFKSNSFNEYLGSIVFSLCVFLLYLFSCIYHGLASNKAKWLVFKRLDHCSIYILIGGTYTPIILSINEFSKTLFNTSWFTIAILILIIMWLIVITGVVFKSIWISRFKYIHLGLYLLLGWSAILYFKFIYLQTLPGVLLVLLGGIFYTIGVVFYVFPKVKYFHFIWHIFTSLGTISHFLALYFFFY